VNVKTESSAQTLEVAQATASVFRPGDVILLSGDLGVGKTVFAKGVARALGIEEPVISPTFNIIRTYQAKVPLVHVDVYRLESMQELIDLGLEEIMPESAVTLVEWGDTVAAQLPVDTLEVQITNDGGDQRSLTFVLRGTWTARETNLSKALQPFRVS